MPTISNPTTFADFYGIDPVRMAALGVLNPTLGVDTKLFVDPLLLGLSVHGEIRNDGLKQYVGYFEKIINLLGASSREGDVAWRNATRYFQFHEIPATCLGYGASSIRGSAFGKEIIRYVMRTGKEIVDMGVRDPDLFVALALFEDGIGPDRISDMTTHVIVDALIKFNSRILTKLGIAGQPFTLLGRRTELAANPLQQKRTPVLLVPTDVLRELPLATDWDDVADAADHNAALRTRVNDHLGHIWAAKTKRNKRILREQALKSAEAFKTLLDVLHKAENRPYNVVSDPSGLHRWAEDARAITHDYPLQLQVSDCQNLDDVYNVVRKIVSQFRQLVERNGLVKSLWRNGRPLPEQYSQRLFFAVAYAYCKANNLDISPEADAGRGPVDFKVSKGFNSRVLVEIKLSTNLKLLAGYTKQLETYKLAEESLRAIYLVVDVGRLGKKDEMLYKRRNESSAAGNPVSDIEIVNGIPKPSASKL
jgi:hypothetical protein